MTDDDRRAILAQCQQLADHATKLAAELTGLVGQLADQIKARDDDE